MLKVIYLMIVEKCTPFQDTKYDMSFFIMCRFVFCSCRSIVDSEIECFIFFLYFVNPF